MMGKILISTNKYDLEMLDNPEMEMKYTAQYVFEGRGKGMPYLVPGDVVELTNGQRIRIKWVRIHEGETVFDTDGLGIVYARELERV